jgi:hypothetical protein
VVQRIRNRLAQRAKNPTAVFVAQLDAYMDREDWPFSGTPFEERMAPEYLASVYANGRATAYAQQWVRDHGLEDSRGADLFGFCASILDLLMMEDELVLVNSVAAEAIARRMYGLEQVFRECKVKGDAQKKARWKVLPNYDVVTHEASGTRVPVADQAARKLLESEALVAKWMTKAGKAGVGE